MWPATCRAPLLEPEHQREDHHYDPRPHGIDRQVRRLPPLQSCEPTAPADEPRVEHGRPAQVHHQDEVLPQGGHLVGAEAERGDARQDGREGQGVHEEGADHQHERQGIEEAGSLAEMA